MIPHDTSEFPLLYVPKSTTNADSIWHTYDMNMGI